MHFPVDFVSILFFLEPEWMKVFFTISFRLLDVQRALDQCSRSNIVEKPD